MKILAGELAIGDVFQVNDWQLHVIAVEHEAATAVRTAEFEFLLHFTSDDVVDVEAPRASQTPRSRPRLAGQPRPWQPNGVPVVS